MTTYVRPTPPLRGHSRPVTEEEDPAVCHCSDIRGEHLGVQHPPKEAVGADEG